jgi:hypothetical protein
VCPRYGCETSIRHRAGTKQTKCAGYDLKQSNLEGQFFRFRSRKTKNNSQPTGCSPIVPHKPLQISGNKFARARLAALCLTKKIAQQIKIGTTKKRGSTVVP